MNIKYGLRGLFAAAVLASSGCVAYGYPASPGYPAGGPSYGRPSPGQGGMQTFRCESHKGRTQYCNADTRDGVRFVRQQRKNCPVFSRRQRAPLVAADGEQAGVLLAVVVVVRQGVLVAVLSL